MPLADKTQCSGDKLSEDGTAGVGTLQTRAIAIKSCARKSKPRFEFDEDGHNRSWEGRDWNPGLVGAQTTTSVQPKAPLEVHRSSICSEVPNDSLGKKLQRFSAYKTTNVQSTCDVSFLQ